MDFQTFTDHMVDLLQDRMGDAYEIRVISVTKTNDVVLTGLVIDKQDQCLCPTVYLESLYEEMKEGAGLSELVAKIINCYEEQSMAVELDMDFFCDYEKVKDRIFYKLINFEKNRRFLQETPYIRWKDLAIVFYYAMDEKVVSGGFITVKKQHMLMWEQNEESLYFLAERNTRRGMPELLVSMRELIREMTGVSVRGRIALPMYVLTNREKCFGAAAMLYSEKLAELAERFGNDLLILPSSVHEVLVLPDDRNQRYDFYRRTVMEVNDTQVGAEEVLSYGLYRYCRENAEIEEIIS